MTQFPTGKACSTTAAAAFAHMTAADLVSFHCLTIAAMPVAALLVNMCMPQCSSNTCCKLSGIGIGNMQGMEKDIILLATTITHAGNFATDAQRVNVAFTRAKHHLVVLGSSPVLRSCSPAFRLLLAGCQMLPAGAALTARSTPPEASGTKPPPSSSTPPSAMHTSVASLAASHAQALGPVCNP